MAFLQRALDDATAAAVRPLRPVRRRVVSPPSVARAALQRPRAQLRPHRRRGRAARAVAERHGAARRARSGPDPGRGAGRGRPRRGPADRPRLGQRLRDAARPARRPGPTTPCVRACVGVLRDWGWARRPAASSPCRRAAGRSWSRSLAEAICAERPAAAAGRWTSWTAARPASQAATAPSGSPACGSGCGVGPTGRGGALPPTDRCCWSTTSWTPVDAHGRRPRSCAGPVPTRCCPSPSRRGRAEASARPPPGPALRAIASRSGGTTTPAAAIRAAPAAGCAGCRRGRPPRRGTARTSAS